MIFAKKFEPVLFPLNKRETAIAEILRTMLDIPQTRRIGRRESLAEDLGCDSLDRLELLITLEEEFDVAIGDEAFDTVKTVADLCNLIKETAA